MQLTPNFYVYLYALLKERFTTEWPEGEAPTSDYHVWRLTTEIYNKKKKAVEEQYVVKQRLNAGERYFYQRLKEAELKLKEADGHIEPVGMKDSIAVACFRYMDCEGRNRMALQKHFYSKYVVPNDTIEDQDKLDRKNAKLLIPIQSIAQPKPGYTFYEGHRGKCRYYLAGTKWWLYFYGYEVPENSTYADSPWKLLSLVMTVTDEGNANLDIRIKNKRDLNHYDYRGSTDFDNSSDTVLTMHLYTEPGSARQLNVYFNVGTGAGNIFMGQYLNYDERGYIFSGSIIMERIDSVLHPDPKPHAFTIARDATNLHDYPEEVRHIAPLLQDRQLNFRRTPITVHSQTEMEIWRNKRIKRKK